MSSPTMRRARCPAASKMPLRRGRFLRIGEDKSGVDEQSQRSLNQLVFPAASKIPQRDSVRVSRSLAAAPNAAG